MADNETGIDKLVADQIRAATEGVLREVSVEGASPFQVTWELKHSGRVEHVMVDPATHEKAALIGLQTEQQALDTYVGLVQQAADKPDDPQSEEVLIGALQTVYAHGQQASLHEYLKSHGVQGQLPTATEVASGSVRFPTGSGKAQLLQALPGWMRQRLDALGAQIPVNEILLEDVPFIDDPKLHDEIAYNQMLSLAAALEEGAVEARQAGDTGLAIGRLRQAAEVLRRAAKHWTEGTPKANSLDRRADIASSVAAQLASAGAGAGAARRDQTAGSTSFERHAFELGQNQADQLRAFVVRIQRNTWCYGLE